MSSRMFQGVLLQLSEAAQTTIGALQQDAFDEIDAVTPMERQEDILNMIIDICHTEFEFDNFNEVMDYFKKMINICKQMNYSKFKSEEYDKFYKQLQELVAERKV